MAADPVPHPLSYARIIYRAVRSAGRNPLAALGRGLSVFCREATCLVAGHSWSWTLAVALGTTDRPVCERCLIAAPRESHARGR
jgi:hypothetical protein